ncbi:MAG: FKBP-type peptidylprolyl isomerase [Mucilaginibacter sp.]|nr:FKBP-type peptidylprolyl isomerase [Mucilaginibacter sp.]
MNIEANRVVSLRFVMKNNNGDVIEDIMNQAPVDYLHGSGNISPALEAAVEGLKVGDKKLIVFKKAESSGENYQMNVVVDNIRLATPSELKSGKPEPPKDETCGPGCCC